MTIGERLKIVIKSKGFKLTEFAKISQIPYRTLQGYVANERMIGTDSVIKICSELRITSDWLLMDEGQMELSLSQEPKSPEEIDKIMKDLNPEQRQEILSRSMEMKKMNDLEAKTERMAKCLEDLEEKLEGKI